jgi:hypothetical protein
MRYRFVLERRQERENGRSGCGGVVFFLEASHRAMPFAVFGVRAARQLRLFRVCAHDVLQVLRVMRSELVLDLVPCATPQHLIFSLASLVSLVMQLTTITPTSKILLSFVGIGCQGIISLLTLIVLPTLNSKFGVARVYLLLKFVLGACACAMLSTSDPIILTVLCMAIGVPLAAMDSNPYTMAEDIAEDDSSRGYFIGVLDNMLTIGQVLVAAASGAIIQYMGEGQIGIARMFALFGAFALVVDAAVTVCSIKYQLFAPRLDAQAAQAGAAASRAPGIGDDDYSAKKPALSMPLLSDHD